MRPLKNIARFSAGTTRKFLQAKRQIIFRSEAENLAMIFYSERFFLLAFSFPRKEKVKTIIKK